MLADNPHIRFTNTTRRGYVRMEVRRERLTADLRAMRTISQPESDAETLASFVVDNGRPGATRSS
jgi:alkaline phosphatase D